MRLTCPNCGAQYEVPDQVIPLDGRDVQCSNCGDTWFQDHPDNPAQDPAEIADENVVETWRDDDVYADDDEDDWQSSEADYDETPAQPEPALGKLRDGVRDVLREEADREARLRAQEQSSGLESQPDLGLDAPEDDARRRAQEARTRMARMRGEETAAQADPEPDTSSRRGLLPDIEEINSSLKSGGNSITTAAAPTIAQAAPKTSGSSRFSRGFALSMALAVILLLVYTNAPKISQALPQVDPALNAYVTFVDNARIWLDQQMARLTPSQ